MASVNILKRIKVGGRWKFFAIPHTEKGGASTGKPFRRALLPRMVSGRKAAPHVGGTHRFSGPRKPAPEASRARRPGTEGCWF